MIYNFFHEQFEISTIYKHAFPRFTSMQIHDLRAYKSTIYEQGNPRFTISGCLKRHSLKRFPLSNALKPQFCSRLRRATVFHDDFQFHKSTIYNVA